MMLTFTQLELLHVSAATMAAGSSAEATKEFSDQRFHQPLLRNGFFPCREKKGKKRGRKKRISKQRRYAVSKQRTMVSGLAMVYLVLSALAERERARAGKN